ncbi:P-loop containing nucleoside triphosphate hydrolase [Pseudocohnilembus persalinus]|uniref:p-loop containing nucleoside triphosphate hydrolase n=1 Tax=Pseudocohnilembus persalinus TaxID=266149 RepID=A0A0V0QB64_PSEPJ|nr:P-loop containing nucleoside triphosphate hydrolase [Pseudocohnilembus persalinus]|eukprot:KRW99448.1 P-loop containing nucleoside triphosphate hydrolase [Pseudocohnilembus persalinus]
MLTFKNDNFQSVYDFLNKCSTIIGRRELKMWIKQPLKDKIQIERRLDIVEALINNELIQNFVQKRFLRFIPDIDKLFLKFSKIYQIQQQDKEEPNFQKLGFKTSLEDAVKVYQLVYNIKNLVTFLEQDQETENQFKGITYNFKVILEDCIKLIEFIENAAENDFHSLRIGDEPLNLLRKKNEKLIYFTTKSFQNVVDEYYSYTMIYDEEYQKVTNDILSVISSYSPVLEQSAILISELDILNSFAQIVKNSQKENEISQNLAMCKPKINTQQKYHLKNIYHPCIEKNNLVTNDIQNEFQNEIHLIMGPNMGGKSTYIRTVAVNVLLAHIGCYVCGSEADINLTSAILTRVGASDFQLNKISTFMRRGTSTYDGIGISWALCEFLAQNKNGLTLFATHFQELQNLKDQFQNIKVYYVGNLDNKKEKYKHEKY